MHKRNLQRCAKAIQSECGERYQRAHYWTKQHEDEIIGLITDPDGNIDWRELKDAATSLWRRANG